MKLKTAAVDMNEGLQHNMQARKACDNHRDGSTGKLQLQPARC